MPISAFLSYSTIDKLAAAKIKQRLERAQIAVFMAHDDTQVSEEWRLRLLKELRSSNLFVCLLTSNYLASAWCMQESGIAIYRRDLVVVPLSIDGTLPPGFMTNVQAIKFNPDESQMSELGAAILRKDFEGGIEFLLIELESSSGFREAEANMRSVLPHVPKMSDFQVARLLSISANTYRIIAANLCISDYLPPLVRKYGHLATPESLATLKKACRI
jgi:TIR domain